MKFITASIALVASTLPWWMVYPLSMAAPASATAMATTTTTCGTSYAVTANRGSGDISFLTANGATNFVVPLPTSHPNPPEPMYVSHSRNRVFVGDRASNSVVVFDPKDLLKDPVTISDVCAGIFHQWSNDDHLVVACDVDRTVAVIDFDSMTVQKRIDLTRQNELSIDGTQKPHDIVITPNGQSIFVSILGDFDDSDDALLKIDVAEGIVVAKLDLPAGTDPHLALSPRAPDLLYSPQQNLGLVAVYNQDDLSEAQEPLVLPHAHGVSTSPDGRFMYFTNINSNGGVGALETVRAASAAASASFAGPPVDAPGEGKPHNVAVSQEGYVFVTHSGATASQVSAYSTDEMSGLPTLVAQHEVGTNPFGIAIVRYDCKSTGDKYFMYGGYTSTTNVEGTAERDEIQATFEVALSVNPPDICPNLVEAEEFFDGVLLGQSPPFLKDIPTYTGTKSRIFHIFSSFYGINSITNNYARKWAKAALEGGTFGDNDFGDWGIMTDGCIGQQESAKKGTAYLSGLLEVNQYMEQASELIRNDNCVLQFGPCEDAAIAWNKAAAFFVGSLEGAKGVFVSTDVSGNEIPVKPYGKMLYALGDKRCRNFRKCGVNADSDAKNLPSKTNIVAIALFQKGAGFVFAGDVDSLQQTIQEINSQILITFIQGSLRYGYRLGGDSDKGKELGEGATFAACAAPQLWAIDTKAGKFVSKQYEIGPEGPASEGVFDFVGVRNAFECNYEKLGISCDEVGALWDDDEATEPKSRQCKDLKECKKRKNNSIPGKKDCKPYTKNKNKKDFYPTPN